MTTPFAVAPADGKILGLISQGLFSGAVALVWAVLVVEVFGRVLVDLIEARRDDRAAAEQQQQQRRLVRQVRRQQPALFPGIDRARRRLNRLNARF